MKCIQCSINTNNPRFCSRSCSVTYNNTVSPKRGVSKQRCGDCGKRNSYSASLCKKCSYKYQVLIEQGQKRISDFKWSHIRHKYESIRQHAHRVAKYANIEKKCKCGYTLHVELCHIKPIGKFSKETPLSVVNAPTNLIFLCPTHHWELDNGYLKLQCEISESN